MIRFSSISSFVVLLIAGASVALAGPYAPGVGLEGSTAIAYDDPRFVFWADAVVAYQVGLNVADIWSSPEAQERTLGPAGTDTFDVACLGEGGEIVLGFPLPIADGPGADFAVFENAISEGYLELAFVEVSSNGTDFVRFPSATLIDQPTNIFGQTDPSFDSSDLDGLASKYPVGFGTPFDLSDLRGVAGAEVVDLNNIRFIRLLDIIGDGRSQDSAGRPIYDPYSATPGGNPVNVSTNGFDLDAVGVLNHAQPQVVELTAAGDTQMLRWSIPGPGKWTLESSNNLNDWKIVETRSVSDHAATLTFSLTLNDASEPVFYRLHFNGAL